MENINHINTSRFLTNISKNLSIAHVVIIILYEFRLLKTLFRVIGIGDHLWNNLDSISDDDVVGGWKALFDIIGGIGTAFVGVFLVIVMVVVCIPLLMCLASTIDGFLALHQQKKQNDRKNHYGIGHLKRHAVLSLILYGIMDCIVIYGWTTVSGLKDFSTMTVVTILFIAPVILAVWVLVLLHKVKFSDCDSMI